MPLLPTVPPDYIDIIFNAGLIGQNLLNMYHREEPLLEEWYEFEEILSTIHEFFEAGFDDEDFQEYWLSLFIEQNSNELNAIRYIIEDEEDNETIVFNNNEIKCE